MRWLHQIVFSFPFFCRIDSQLTVQSVVGTIESLFLFFCFLSSPTVSWMDCCLLASRVTPCVTSFLFFFAINLNFWGQFHWWCSMISLLTKDCNVDWTRCTWLLMDIEREWEKTTFPYLNMYKFICGFYYCWLITRDWKMVTVALCDVSWELFVDLAGSQCL